MTKLAEVLGAEQPGFSNRALWSLGFRPFYLLASAYASCSVMLWAGYFVGILPAAMTTICAVVSAAI